MKIALLCPGPSLVERYQPAGWDMVVAVNSAAWLFPVDWLAFSDSHIIAPIQRGEHPWPAHGVVTNGAHDIPRGVAKRRMPMQDAQSPYMTPEMRELAASQGMTECAWTFPNALLFCLQHAGAAGEVHVFGFDCTGHKQDVAGVDGFHTADRWARELPWVRLLWDGRCVQHGKATL